MDPKLLASWLRRLLLNNDCVILPGFGAFIVNREPARIHPVLHSFTPPSESLTFNSRLINNDGLLAHTMVEEQSLSFESATAKLQAFGQRLQKELVEGAMIKLEGIGKLSCDVEQNLQFAPQPDQTLQAESYGLPLFELTPVMRKEKAKTQEAQVAMQPKRTRRRRRVALPALVLCLLGAAAMIQMMVMDKYVDGLAMNQGSLLQLFSRATGPGLDQELSELPSMMDAQVGALELERMDEQPIDYRGLTAEAQAARAANNKNAAPTQAELNAVARRSDEAAQKPTPKPATEKAGAKSVQPAPKTTATADAATKATRQLKALPKTATSQGTVQNGGYYIVLGAFKEPSNAVKFAAKMGGRYDGVINSVAKNGFHRVGYFAGAERTDAVFELRQAKRSHPSAWLMRL